MGRYIAHYGILGMRWGQHKGDTNSTGNSSYSHKLHWSKRDGPIAKDSQAIFEKHKIKAEQIVKNRAALKEKLSHIDKKKLELGMRLTAGAMTAIGSYLVYRSAATSARSAFEKSAIDYMKKVKGV